MIAFGKICKKCSEPILDSVRFCPACGAPALRQNASPPDLKNAGVATKGQVAALTPSTHPMTRYGWLVWVAAFCVLCALVYQGKFDEQLEWIIAKLGSPPELSLQIIRVDQVTARFGYLQITNPTKETVTLQRVTINNSDKPGCSFDVANSISLGKPTLSPGDTTTLGTMGMAMGACGPFIVVTVRTDKGSLDYSFK